ncbi:MAG TPA: hypothetical protein VGI78_19990 [Acetobacteraceae bacterium]
MTATSTERVAAGWLGDLGKLTAGAAPLADARAKIAALASALAEEFDASAFNRNSLIFVARQCKFFPSFGEAYQALTEWRQDHPLPPRHTAITGQVDGPNEQQLRKVQEEHDVAEESWRGISEPAIFAKIRALDGLPTAIRLSMGRILATALRRHAPRMLGLLPPEFLTANDDRSAA